MNFWGHFNIALTVALAEGWRNLRRPPWYFLLSVLILAVGAGASAATLKLVRTLFFGSPAVVRNPAQLYQLDAISNYLGFLDLRDRAPDLQAAAYVSIAHVFSAGARSAEGEFECVTPEYFDVLGVSLRSGRGFVSNDNGAREAPPVVLSARSSAVLGGQHQLLGELLTIGDRPHRVIGIAPDTFSGLEERPVEGWILFEPAPELCSFTGENILFSSGSAWLTSIARLRDPAEIARAGVAAVDVVGRLKAHRRSAVASVTPILSARHARLSRYGVSSSWLLGGALTLLLIGCTNAIALLAIRGIERQRDDAIRQMLGATRASVVATTIVDHSLAACATCAGAVAVFTWVWQLLSVYFPIAAAPSTRVSEWGLAATLSVGSCAVVSVGPMYHGLRTTASRRRLSAHSAPGRSYGVLLTFQVAISIALLSLAGLFQLSIENAKRGLGLDLQNVGVISVDSRTTPLRDRAQLASAFGTLLVRIRSLPSVEAAALSEGPLLGSGGASLVGIVGATPTGGDRKARVINTVSEGYFHAVGTPLIEGRDFTAADATSGSMITIISSGLARELWPGASPLHRCVYLQSGCYTVVGVIQTRRSLSIRNATEELFVPLHGDSFASLPDRLIVRYQGDRVPAQVLQFAEQDFGGRGKFAYEPLERLADRQTLTWAAGVLAFRVFGVASLMLGTLGLFVTVSFWTRRKYQEIGIRMALGASGSRVGLLVYRQVLGMIVGGCIVGVILTALATRFLRSALFNIAVVEWRVYVVVIALVLAAGLSGCLWPAWRAARLHPGEVLRHY